MSAVSSSSGAGLFQFLQGLSQYDQSPATSIASGTGSTGSVDTTGDANTQTSAATQGAQGHHHHGGGSGGNGEFFQKIQQAVSSALQSAQSSGSTSDPNQIVENAIASVLGTGSSSNSSSSASGTTAADGSTSTTTNSNAGSTTTPGTSPQEAFSNLLQSAGITAQQFHADFLSAVKDAQGGNVNSSTAFQNFGPGAALNTAA